MPTPYEPRTSGPALDAPRLVRPTGDRVLAGVCAGLAEHLDLPVARVRLAMAALCVAGGAGVVVYLFLWATAPSAVAGVPARLRQPTPARTGPAGLDASTAPTQVPSPPAPHEAVGSGIGIQSVGAAPRPNPRPSEPSNDPAGRAGLPLVVVGLTLALAGALLFLEHRGIRVWAGVAVPVLVVGAGIVIAWSQLDQPRRTQLLGGGGETSSGRLGLARVAAGLGLAVVGLVVLVTRGQSVSTIWSTVLATAAVLAGAGLITTPFLIRLWRDLRAEQVAAARATERADIAAHLHDSVLQTLALIQRRAADPQAVHQLARAQERELRSWLYAGPSGSQDSLAAAVTGVAHEVEDLHGIPIDLVVTGDRPLEQHGQALAQALREALLNAVRHGAAPVSAYVEVRGDGVEAFVRDHGPGFDVDQIAADRLGVRESVLGRMARHGGTARVRRLQEGTEVELTLPALEEVP